MNIEDLGSNLRRYMKLRGTTVPELAEKSTVSKATISNILNGKSDPSFSIIQKLCDALGIVQAELYAEKYSFKSLRFRTQKTFSAREKAAKETLLFTVKDKLDLYLKYENQYQKNHETDLWTDIMHLSFPSDPIKAAHMLRKNYYLSEKTPVCNISPFLSAVGIKQFYFSFGLSQISGFSLGEADGGPAIFVNTGTATPERWIFTIFHELGHLLLHSGSYGSEVVIEDKNSKEEQDANEFAAEFLMPFSVVKESLQNLKGADFVNKIFELKQMYSVSYMTVLRKFCEDMPEEYGRGLAWFRHFCNVSRGFSFENNAEPCGISKDKFVLEDCNFRNYVFDAVLSGKISTKIAADALEWDENNLKEILNIGDDYLKYEEF